MCSGLGSGRISPGGSPPDRTDIVRKETHFKVSALCISYFRTVWTLLEEEAATSHPKCNTLGSYLGMPTESNKWYSVVGVSGPILKSTTDITWGPGDRVSHPVRGRPGLWGDTAKRGRRMMFNHKGGPYSLHGTAIYYH